jgi:Ca2+-binding RTX toxin-like protein
LRIEELQQYFSLDATGKMSSSVPVTGSAVARIVTISAGNFTAGAATLTDYVYLIAGAHTVTMPTALVNTNRYTIKNNHSAAITVNTTLLQTIDGTTTISIGPGSSVDLVSDTLNWRVI